MVTNSYTKLSDKVRSSLIESPHYPFLKKLLEQSPIDYKSKKSELIVNALIKDEILSKYTLLSIFDDRILVTDNGHSLYYLPYSIDKDNKLKFQTIIPSTLIQTEAKIVKTVMLSEIEKMIKDFSKGKISENISTVVDLGLEKLRLDSLAKSIEKTSFDENAPVFLLRFPILAEAWSKWTISNPKNTLVEKTRTIVESYEALYGFRIFLESEKGVKYGHYVNASEVDGLMLEYAKYRGEDLSEMERATLINFFKNRVKFLEENSIISKVCILKENDGDLESFQQTHPDMFGYEVTADISTDNTALNKSMLINYKPLLINGRDFMSGLATQKLPGDLKKIVSSLLIRIDTTLVRMDTNYQWSMQDNYDLQDLLRVINKMIAVASGLSTIKAVMGVEEPTPTDTTNNSNIPASPYTDPEALEMTGSAAVGIYPTGFRSKTKEGNAYPEPIRASHVGESVVVREGMYFTEAKIVGFNIYTGLYEVRLQDGRVLNLDEYNIEFRDSGLLQRPEDKKTKDEEPEEIMPTLNGDKEKDIIVDKSKKETTK